MHRSPVNDILHVAGLCFSYPQRALFVNLSARIAPGLTLVRGGDGSGKTTLVRLLAGVLPASAGELRANGVCLRERPTHYQQHVFWVDPRTETFDSLTPVDYFRSVQQGYCRFDEQLLAGMVAGLSLGAHLHKAIDMLSTGSKRKVWLAAAFASGAAVTLLDEPFAALDKGSIAFVMERLDDAAAHPTRAFVLADYAAPLGVALAQTIDLGD
jgi:ABC-type multidrug transport system ATPase subunit